MPRKTNHKKNCTCVTCQEAQTVQSAPWVEPTYQAQLERAWPPGRAKAQPKPDALQRLEAWISAQEPRRHRMVRYIALLDRGKSWRVNLGVSSHGFWGDGATLSAAIHAALDEAGAER